MQQLSRQQIIILAIAGVLGLMAILGVNYLITQQKQELIKQTKKAIATMKENQTTVLIAKKRIPKGATLTSNMVETKIVFKQEAQQQAVPTSERVENMVSLIEIPEGDQITFNKIAKSGNEGGLAASVPAGKRAITISVDNISSLVGMISAGDYVDVSYVGPVPYITPDGKQAQQAAVIPLFQNAVVLAVGQQIGAVVKKESRYSEDSKGSAPLITLALTSKEANLIAFLQEQGRIRLTLRSPADAQVEQIQPANWDTVFRYIMPESTVKKTEAPQVEYVEVYRGLNKEQVPLSK